MKIRNDYECGDCIPPEGGILVGDNCIMQSGIVYVTRKQAERAEAYGWRKIWGGSMDGGKLVRVER
jgi:hypothetical protein